MLTSITPLGEQGRGNRWAVTTTAYAGGCLLGGAVTGLVLGAVGAALPDLPGLWLAGLACLLAAAADLAATTSGRRLPGGRRQVDRAWLDRYRGWVYGAGRITGEGSAASWPAVATLMGQAHADAGST